jgi:adenylate cyclase
MQKRSLLTWSVAGYLWRTTRNGQILVDAKVHAAVETLAEDEPAGELVLKGFHQPVRAFNMRKLKS